jgi:polysaccharide biosynthesis/export protein
MRLPLMLGLAVALVGCTTPSVRPAGGSSVATQVRAENPADAQLEVAPPQPVISGAGGASAPIAGPAGRGSIAGPGPASSGRVTTAELIPGTPEAGDGIGALDTLDVQVFGVEELSRTVEVDSSGNITLPLIGSVNVLNQTPGEAAQIIEQRYRGPYLVDPSVTVRVSARQGRVVSLGGAVMRPGVYPFVGPTTLLQAITLGGGVEPSRGGDTVQLLRRRGRDEFLTVYSLSAIRSGAAVDPWLISGDRVEVSGAERFVTVTGFVRAPGVFPMSGDVTLTQALALGGGGAENADFEAVRIFRRSPTGDVVSNVNMEDVLASRAVDPMLMPGDRVVVSGYTSQVLMDGAMDSPKALRWRPGLNLTTAIAQAGGISNSANQRGVVIVRLIDGQTSVSKHDLRAINSGAATDPLLQPDDRVIVGEDQIAAFLNRYGTALSLVNLLAVFRN